MSSQKNTSSTLRDVPSVWDRWASLLGRLLILFAVIYCPLVFFTWTWRHYHVPKTASFQYIIMLLLACWGVIAVRWRSLRSPLATPAAIFFMTIMVTSLWAVNLAEAWETILFLAASMVFMVLVVKFFTQFKDFVFVAFLLGISCLVVDIYALAQWFHWQGWATDPEFFCFIRRLTPKPVSFMGNENYVAQYMNIALPICFAMMLCYRRKPVQLIFFTLITLLNAITVVYIDSNATFAGFVVAIPVAAILIVYFKAIPFIQRIGVFHVTRDQLEERFRNIMVLMIMGVSILAVVGSVVPNKVRAKMASMANWMDSDGDLIPDGVAPIVFRLQCMDGAARNIIDSPLTGIGAGNFKVLHPMYETQLERKVLGEETLAREVHNDHLTFAVEQGIFGSFGWYWVIAATFFAIFRSLRLLEFQSITALSLNRKSSFYQGILFSAHIRDFYFYMQWGILTGLITALISCMFDQTFIIVSGAIMFWYFSGVSAAIYQILHLASRGIRNNLLGITPEPATPIQKSTRRLPSYVWIAFFFLSLLPFGVLNTYQLIGESWLRYGMNENLSKNYYGMFKCFQNTMRLYPYQMETFYMLGRYYIDAVVDIETAAMSEDKQTPLPAGLRYEDRRRLNEEGIVILQTDLFMNPNYKWAHNNLGVLYDRYYDLVRPGEESVGTQYFTVTPDPELATSVMAASNLTYQRVLAIDEEQVFAHFNLGLGAIKMKDYNKAIDELNEALITDPSRYDIYKYLSNCYNQINNYRRALRAAEKYLEKSLLVQAKKYLAGNQNLAHYQQILQMLRNNEFEKAVSLARLLFQFEDKDAYTLLVSVGMKLVQETVDPNDLNLPTPEYLAKCVELAKKILANPTANNYLWHAKIYEKIRKYDKAAEEIEEYLRLKPNDDDIRNSLMMIYVQLNDLAHAFKVMETLVSRQPDNWKYLVTYARLQIGQSSPWEQIFPILQRAIQVGGDEARKIIAENQPGNLLLPQIKADPRMRDLLGSFFPADATPSQPVEAVPSQPANATPSPSTEAVPSQSTEAVQSQSTESIQSATP